MSRNIKSAQNIFWDGVLSSSVIRLRRVLGSNPIWDSYFCFAFSRCYLLFTNIIIGNSAVDDIPQSIVALEICWRRRMLTQCFSYTRIFIGCFWEISYLHKIQKLKNCAFREPTKMRSSCQFCQTWVSTKQSRVLAQLMALVRFACVCCEAFISFRML